MSSFCPNVLLEKVKAITRELNRENLSRPRWTSIYNIIDTPYLDMSYMDSRLSYTVNRLDNSWIKEGF